MAIQFRPLGKVSNIIQATGLEMSYAYDDLVFADNSVFIIRFSDKSDSEIHLYFNVDCELIEKKRLEKIIRDEANNEKLTLLTVGDFSLQQIEGKEEISIVFQ